MKAFATQVAVVAAVKDYGGYDFEQYKNEFSVEFSSAEDVQRERNFHIELRKVQEQNELYKSGKSKWHAEMNEYSILTEQEFKSTMLGHVARPNFLQSAPNTRITSLGNPTRKDWREDGVVTPVKNQGHCGSCWAFASTEVIESHFMMASGQRDTVLAPQYLVNCVKNPHSCGGTGGCSGAVAQLAFNLTSQVAIPLETDLPYTAKDGTCGKYPGYVITDGYQGLPANDASALETAIATQGPIAVSVCASKWGKYGGGVFEGGCDDDGCSVNHAVVAVGYDVDYWLIRNSWGTGWGEGGYIRLTRKSDQTIFVDRNPASGYACKPYPATQIVAGESGVLSDSVYPLRARLAKNTLGLVWKDCGDGVYGDVVSVTPDKVGLGEVNVITGTVQSKINVAAGNFNAVVKAGGIALAHCSGPLGRATTCQLPLAFGTLQLNAVKLPIQAGLSSVSMQLKLAANAPPLLKAATTRVTAASESNQGFVCLDVSFTEEGGEPDEGIVV